MIIIASPSKPFSFTGKGTLRRQAIINDYADEIEAAYKAVENDTQESFATPSRWTRNSTALFVRRVIERTLKVSAGHIDGDSDLFEIGLDR